MRDYLKNRLAERSTWAGLGSIVTSVGTALATGNRQEAIVAGLFGLLAVLAPTGGAAR